MKFSIKDFFCKCDQIRSVLRISSHSLRKSLLEDFILSTEWLFIIENRNIGNYFHQCLTKFQIRQFLLRKRISHFDYSSTSEFESDGVNKFLAL